MYEVRLHGSMEFEDEGKMKGVINAIENILKKNGLELWVSIERVGETEIDGETVQSRGRTERKIG